MRRRRRRGFPLFELKFNETHETTEVEALAGAAIPAARLARVDTGVPICRGGLTGSDVRGVRVGRLTSPTRPSRRADTALAGAAICAVRLRRLGSSVVFDGENEILKI